MVTRHDCYLGYYLRRCLWPWTAAPLPTSLHPLHLELVSASFIKANNLWDETWSAENNKVVHSRGHHFLGSVLNFYIKSYNSPADLWRGLLPNFIDEKQWGTVRLVNCDEVTQLGNWRSHDLNVGSINCMTWMCTHCAVLLPIKTLITMTSWSSVSDTESVASIPE